MENQEPNQREFDLGTILNITTGRLFTSMDDIYEILEYLSSDSLATHQLSRVAGIARDYILSIYPELKGVGEDVEINSFDEAKVFIDEQKKLFGKKLALRPMTKEDGYSHVDPEIEAIEMMKGKTR